MAGSYFQFLVAASILLASSVGYCTIEASAQIRSTKQAKRYWLGGSAFVLGTGIWALHFIGMLAYALPAPLSWDLGYTAISWMTSIAMSAFALHLVQREKLTVWQFVSVTSLMGLSIIAMHYIGMVALMLMPSIQYHAPSLWLSLLGAICISAAAIGVLRRITDQVEHVKIWYRLVVAFAIGAVTAAARYVEMAAIDFSLSGTGFATGSGLDGGKLRALVSAATALFVLGAIFMEFYKRRVAERESIEQTDPLTRLHNRHALQKQLPRQIADAKANNKTLHIALVDIDAFKLVNHTHGHATGDEVLVTAARRIEECLRQHDMVIRVGGDEYMVILSGANGSVASIMDRIIKKLNVPMVTGSDSVTVSASVGLAEYVDGETVETLLSRADAARQHAKRDGRNTWRAFSPDMDGERLAAAETHKGLRRAFERDEFRLYYQPKFRSGTREIVGVEALIRWKDPSRGLRMPGEFIEIAERTGLIAALGDWVLNEACRQIGCWMKQGWLVPVSINLSALQVRNVSIAGKVKEALAQHDVNAGTLTLEITESVAIEDPQQAMKVFQSLRDCGVSISIDDFGTGYSSLAYLRDFPAGELKIDKAFVRDIATNRQALELVKAIVAMGHALGMLVVAEGVEDEITTQLLEDLGCDVLQGYFFGVPMTASELQAVLANGPKLEETSVLLAEPV